MIPYFISHTTFHFLYTMHPPQHSHADPPPADPDLLRFSSTQPDLTGICACRVAGIEKEGRNCEPGTGAGKWDASRFPVPILSHSSALFFSPAAPQVRSHARSDGGDGGKASGSARRQIGVSMWGWEDGWKGVWIRQEGGSV